MMLTDTHTGKAVKTQGKVTELLQKAMAEPSDSPAHQLAGKLLGQQQTALVEQGLELGSQYQISHAEQAKIAAEIANNAVSDRELGELSRLVEQGDLTETSGHDKVGMQDYFSSNILTEEQRLLVKELVKSGEKCTPENIVGIAKTSNGRIVWYETGNERAGLVHTINRHGTQFQTKGISNEKIPNYVMEAICRGQVVGFQGKKTPPRAIYEFTYEGKVQRVAVQIGANGFVVSANPRSMEDMK